MLGRVAMLVPTKLIKKQPLKSTKQPKKMRQRTYETTRDSVLLFPSTNIHRVEGYTQGRCALIALVKITGADISGDMTKF